VACRYAAPMQCEQAKKHVIVHGWHKKIHGVPERFRANLNFTARKTDEVTFRRPAATTWIAHYKE